MSENNALFDAAIVEDGVIVNVLVFDNENTMREFGAVRLAEGQGIGDIYMTPEAYREKQLQENMKSAVASVVNEI